MEENAPDKSGPGGDPKPEKKGDGKRGSRNRKRGDSKPSDNQGNNNQQSGG